MIFIIFGLILGVNSNFAHPKFVADKEYCTNYDSWFDKESEILKVPTETLSCISSVDFVIKKVVIEAELFADSTSVHDLLSIILYEVGSDGVDKVIGRKDLFAFDQRFVNGSQILNINVTSQHTYGYVIIIGYAAEDTVITIENLRFTLTSSVKNNDGVIKIDKRSYDIPFEEPFGLTIESEYFEDVEHATETSNINISEVNINKYSTNDSVQAVVNVIDTNDTDPIVTIPVPTVGPVDSTDPIVTIPFPTVGSIETDGNPPIVTIPFPTVSPIETDSTDPIVTIPFPTVGSIETDGTPPIVTIPFPTVGSIDTDSTDPIVTIPFPTVSPIETDSTDPIVTIPFPTVSEIENPPIITIPVPTVVDVPTTETPEEIVIAGLSTLAIVGITVGSIFGGVLIACGVWLLIRKFSNQQKLEFIP